MSELLHLQGNFLSPGHFRVTFSEIFSNWTAIVCQGLPTPRAVLGIMAFCVQQQVSGPVLECHVITFSLTVPGTISVFVHVHQEANPKIILGVQEI